MSILCEIRSEPRVIAGELKQPGEVAMIPNSLALKLEKKGLVYWAKPEEYAKLAAKRRARREEIELAKMEADDEKAVKKGKR